MNYPVTAGLVGPGSCLPYELEAYEGIEALLMEYYNTRSAKESADILLLKCILL